jgi:amino acid adenylation domain-containing protein
MTETTEPTDRLTEQQRLLLERMSAPAGQREGLFPATAAQRSMWVAQQLRPEASTYNMPALLRLRGALDAGRLATALRRLVAAHEALRTSLIAVDGNLLQHVRAPREHELTVIDATGRPPDAVMAEAAEEAHAAFDLANSSPLRTTLWRLADSDHLLLLVLHHTAADAWSLGVLLQDLATALGADGAPLPVPAVQPADLGLRELAAAGQDGTGFWTEYLAGAGELRLPEPDGGPDITARAAAEESACGIARLPLPDDLAVGVQELARRTGTTSFAVYLAALAAVCQRLTGQRDFVLGASVAQRGAGTERTVGLLVNTLPVRPLEPAPGGFTTLLARTGTALRAAMAHGHVPVEHIVREAPGSRSIGRPSLLNVVFSVISDPFARIRLGDCTVERLPVPPRWAKFPLLVSAETGRDGTGLVAEFDRGRIDAGFAASLLRALRQLLGHVVDDPHSAVDNIDLLTAQDRAAALDLARGPGSEDLLRGRGFGGVVADVAGRHPDRIALVEADRKVTYRELVERADDLAAALVRHGMDPACPVGVALPRSIDQIVSCLGVIRAGGHYLPVDPRQPRERVRYTLEQARARLLIGPGDDFGVRGAAVLRVAPPSGRAPAHPDPGLPGGRPDDLLLVGFTSGSTGRPKGYAVTQQGVARLIGDRRWLAPGPARVFLIANAVTFDASTWEVWGTLLDGATGVIVPEYSYTASVLGALIRQHRATTLHVTTQLFNSIIDEDPYAFRPLAELVIGGEAMSADHVRRAVRCLPGTRLLNAYGPAECAVMATVHELGPLPAAARHVPIGGPVADTEVYVLDERMRVVLPAVAGEVYIGGPRVGLGYTGRPGLTAERFVPSPFAAGGRLYRTGDLARVRPDGTLVCLGRTDQQLKIRGYRVEPGEVEACLTRHPAVDQAVVALSAAGDLTAYVIPAGVAPGASQLRDFLRAELPDYMIPTAVVVLGEFPLTPNGKVDRAALPAPGTLRWAPPAQAPRDELEGTIADVWAEVLGRPAGTISAREDFFDAGGHSLLAARVVARLERRLGRPVPLRLLFEAPTVAGLARSLNGGGTGEETAAQDAAQEAAAQDVPPLAPGPRDARALVSYSQQRLWFLHQMDPGSPLYNLPLAVRLTGEPDAVALHRALRLVFDRHEALRTVFAADDDGTVYQQVLKPGDITLTVVDAARPGATERLADLVARQAALAPFSLAADPPIRAHLIDCGSGEHVLVLTVHHIACDGYSAEILAREISIAYEAALAGADPELSALPVQYRDFARWQRASLTDARRQGMIAHWTRALDGAPPAIELPSDHPRPAVFRYRGATERVDLDSDLTARVREAAAENRVTTFMTMLAGLAVMLHRYTGREDILIGIPVAGRPDPGLENLIGFFANTLVVRVCLAGDPSAWEIIERVHAACLDAFDHQDLPFEQLVEQLRPERDLSRTPIFQVMLAAQGEPMREVRLPGLDATPYTVDNPSARCDLTLLLREGARSITGMLEYNRDLFEPETAARMSRHLVQALAWLAGGNGSRLSDADLADDEERAWLARTGSGPAALADGTGSVLRLIAGQAASSPGAVALAGADGSELTYQQLMTQAGSVAAGLRAAGTGPGAVVAVMLPRGPGMVVAMIGAWLAGAALVPLDPAYPADRLRFMARDAAATVLLTSGDLAGSGVADRELLIEDLPGGPAVTVLPPGGPRPAYILYTSGSTGRPKGVVISHDSLANLLSSMAAEPGLTATDRLVAVTSSSFDMGMLELLGPLTAGGTVIVASRDQVRDPALLAELIERAGATVVQATPATWRMLVRSRWRASRPLRAWAGGEPLSAELAADLLAAGHELWNGYGPTETTVYSTVARVTDPADITIGHPVPGTRIFLLDARLRPVPAGTVGEICIGGTGVAHGYQGRPAMTAERFAPSPEGNGERLYRTGDLGRWDTEGRLVYLGRNDRQIKLRGLRIEPGEVEARLAGHPGVRDCVVVARGDALVAYVVGDQPGQQAGPAGAAALRDYLRGDLPEYMVPSVIEWLGALPLTANGKIDHAALPEPRDQVAAAPAGTVAPRDDLERMVVGAWSSVLERPAEAISVLDDFFSLGGHSLSAMAVAGRLALDLGRQVPVRLVFERPTAAALAQALNESLPRDATAGAPTAPGPALERLPDHDWLPLSFAQERLWFLHQMDPGAPQYNVPLALRMTGELRVDLLHAALLTVVTEHEALRTVIAEDDGRAGQRVLPPSLVLTVVDLSGLGDVSGQGQALDVPLARVLRQAGYAPFDLTSSPPVRATLARTGQEEHVLLVTVHHIACDGASIGLLARRAAEVYAALHEGRDVTPAPLRVQYGDYAAWQRARLSGGALAADLGYWGSALAGAPAALELPADHPRPAVFRYRGAGLPVELDARLTAGVRALAAEHQMTPFMILAAALCVVLGRYSGQEDVVIGTPLANRQHPWLEPLIGFFANTLVLRADLSGDPAVPELLRRIRAACLDAYEHQDVPFERLVEHLHPRRDLSRTPVFQVMLALQDKPVPEISLPGLTTVPYRVENPTAKYDLVFTLREEAETVSGVLEYNRDLFEPPTVQAISDALTAVLAALCEGRGRVSDLPLCEPAQLATLLSGWNRQPGYDPEACLHDLVRRQAAATPDAVAVISDESGEVLTYAELDRRADRLAGALAARGVAAGDLAGVLLPRSPDLIVALLAVLRAGAGFLPLDPEHPAERLTAVLGDAGVLVTVTDATSGAALRGSGQLTVHPGDGAGYGRVTGPRATPAHVAYAIYTSGSTGRPKGVLVPHRAIVNNLLWMQQDWPLDGRDRLLQKTTIAFDVAVKEVFWPLLCGAAVVLARPGGQRDPEYLLDLIDRHGITVAHFVPSMLEAALAHAERTGRAFGPRLEKVMSGAETLPAATLRRFFAATQAELLHMYGPTETAIAVTGWTCPRGYVPERVPLGTPMPGVQLYVLDARLRPVPRGAWGELYAGGLCVGLGYLGRPAESATAFVPDPYSGDGARMYRTGDIVRISHEGLLEFRGRADHQVKVRGFRIELGDVEAALSRHPDVRQAAVVARQQPDGVTHRLDGYVATSSPALTEEALRAHLRAVLPDYMVPATLTVLPGLPVNANGKIDRGQLPESAVSPSRAAVGTGEQAEPATSAELVAVAILREVLGVTAIGLDDDIFVLGGHSLQVPQIAALVAERTGAEVPLREIFLEPTAAGIAAAIGRPREAAPPAITRVDRSARRAGQVAR